VGLGSPLCLCPSGKDHVCRFIGCGRNEKFNYVVMQLQVGPWGPPKNWRVVWVGHRRWVPDGMGTAWGKAWEVSVAGMSLPLLTISRSPRPGSEPG